MTSARIVGLTGGIGSGKSAVSRAFARLGAAVVDADQVARDVVRPNTDGLRAVVDAFGPGVLGPDGTLDREALGSRVFADATARRRLEAILHPLIAQQSGRLLREAVARLHAPYAVYEAALLVETGLHTTFDALVVVTAPVPTRIDRIVRRDGSSPERAAERIAAQASDDHKVAVADYVVDNSGTLDATTEQVLAIDGALRRRFGLVEHDDEHTL